MSSRLFWIGLLGALLLGACQAGQPTLIIMEVTREVPVTVVVTKEVALAVTSTVTPTASLTPNLTPTATLTATPDPFPTPVVGQVFVADQKFEFGRMFWIQPVNQIWVITTQDGNNLWEVYEDTFQDGMPETDPSITPPRGLLQPERGFGKLWRENPQVREALGWALSSELGYNTRYEYHAGGTIEEGIFVASYGYHTLEDIEKRTFQFIEGTWTWEEVIK